LVSAKEIPPGGVGEVKATFHSKGFQGRIKKTLIVETNDPENAGVRLSVAGEVISEITVTPRYVNFGNVSYDGAAKPIPLEIRLYEGRDLKIEEVSADNPLILLKEQKRTEKRFVYAVSLGENVPTGRLTGKITIRTDSRNSPKTEVPVYAFVQGRVQISPPLVSYGMIRPGEPSLREITLSATGDASFSVESVKSSADSVTTEIFPEKEGAIYRIRVTYHPGEEITGRVSERLTIFVGGEREEILEVPVYGNIHAGAKKEEPLGSAKK